MGTQVNIKNIRGALSPGNYYFSGNEAVVEGAIVAGCRFYGGYPISPASEIMIAASTRLREAGGVFIQMEDEIGSISSAIGAVWAGAKAMTATSGPGFDLMQEAIGYAVMTETPLVIVDIQRAGPATGQATRGATGDIMQAWWGSHGDRPIIAISPWSVQEMYDQTINAFNLAEKYRVPVIILSEEAVGHLRELMVVRENVEIFNRVKKPGAPPFDTEEDDGVPPMPAFGEGEHLLVTGSTHDDDGIRKVADPAVQAKLSARLYNKIMNNREKIVDSEAYYLDDAEVVIVAYGFMARSSLFAVEKVREEGGKVGMLRMKTIWPFADRLIRDIGSGAKKILVPEANRGQVAGEITKYAACDVVSYPQTDGEVISPLKIMEQLRRLI